MPETLRVDRCKKCRREIVWAVTANAEIMPLDAEPHIAGNLRLTGARRASRSRGHLPVVATAQRQVEGQTDLFDAVEANGDERVRPERYRSHFATCPQAEHFRRS